MKKSTKFLISFFPFINDVLEGEGKPNYLSKVDDTLIEMARFFEDPEHNLFDLKNVYLNLKGDTLSIALKALLMFFMEDTYLMNNESFFYFKNEDDYLNQSRFAEYLDDNGVNFNNAKLSVYKSRGLLPEPAFTLCGTDYWERSVCEKYLMEHRRNTQAPYEVKNEGMDGDIVE